jgi:polyhydroxyalkanoate synthesis regulator phasin
MWSVMSGIDVSNRQKEEQQHACQSCMNSVVQTFSYYQEQIAQQKREKQKLQMEQKKQMNALTKKIEALEKKVATLEKQK